MAHYRRFCERPAASPAPDGLKILLVGELAYNPERVLALAEPGHRLFGLWTPTPAGFNTVGPLPFDGVEDLPRLGWRDAVRRLRPDVIYALLNWQAVPWAHHVLAENRGVPFVWHFKEGPFICLQKGTWPLLAELHTRADGRIYASPELREWFAAAGLPMIQRANTGAVVATQTLAHALDVGVFFAEIGDLGEQLRDGRRMTMLRDNVRRHRALFIFDHHADRLIAFFREVAAARS